MTSKKITELTTSKKITELTTKTSLGSSDWITGIDIAQGDPALQNIKITKANLQTGLATDASVSAVQGNLDSHIGTNAAIAHPDGVTATDLSDHKTGTSQHPITGVTGLQGELDAKANSADLGTAASRNVGTLNSQVPPGDEPAAAVSAHEAAFVHTRLPTAAQKNALDANPTLSAVNSVASSNDIVDEGINLKSTGEVADKILVTNGLDGFVYENKPVGSGVTTFIALTDTPADYAGQQGKLVKVNATEDGLIYGDPSGTTVSWGDISGTISNQTDLQTELDAKLGDAVSDGNTYSRRNGSWVINPITPIGAVWTEYTFSTDTTATSPASGGIKVNNIVQASATQLYVHGTTGGGNDASNIWGSVQNGDYVGIWEEQSDREGIYYEVTGPPIDNVGWWTIPITVVPGSTASIENGQAVNAFTIVDPRNRNPIGGTAGQVLAKVDAVDHNIHWVTLTASDVNAEPAFSKNSAFNLNFGNSAGTVCQGDDARLSDARSPTAHAASHNHGGADALAVFGAANSGFAPASGGGTSNFLRADGNWVVPPGGGGGWVDGTTVTYWALGVQNLGNLSSNPTVDLNNGQHITAATNGADRTIDFTSGASILVTQWTATVDLGSPGDTINWTFDSVAVNLADGYDISAGGVFLFTFVRDVYGVTVTERGVQ